MEFITANAKKNVKIQVAALKDTAALKRAVMACLQKSNSMKNIDFNTIQENGLKAILDIVISLETSEEFETAVFKCLESCIIDDKHVIRPQLFDDMPELREDYYEIIVACCEENLRPFYKSLASALQTRLSQTE